MSTLGTQFSSAPTKPGFYTDDTSQLRDSLPAQTGRLSGRKTGRPSPQDHVREPAHEDTLRRHDLLPSHPKQVGSNAGFNKNQGQLFDPEVVQPRDTTPDTTVARRAGAPTGEISVKGGKAKSGLVGQPGFMPTLDKKQKGRALNSLVDARQHTGADRGTGAPTAEIMADRAALSDKSSRQTWYQGVDASGQHSIKSEGDATRVVHASAARQGTTSSHMARAVAFTSPQMEWKSMGDARSTAGAGHHPNLESAEGVISAGNAARKANPDVSSSEIADVSRNNAGFALENMAVKAGVKHHETRDKGVGPFPIQGEKSLKAVNFDASLNLSHLEPAVQRVAAKSYTVDRHDADIAGVDSDKHLSDRRGVHEAVAMTGRRTALKQRELPPNTQASQWEAKRAEKGLGRGNEMFAGTNERPVARPDLVHQAPPPSSRSMSRSGRIMNRASDMGIEF